MADYGLEFSFGIDDGELDGLTPQEVFVLGYELGSIRAKLQSGEKIKGQLVHASNRERIERALEGATEWTMTFMENDPSEEWMILNIW